MKQDYWQTFYENGVYHVYNRTNNKELLFPERTDKLYFLRQWQDFLSNYLDTYAYCLMSNHFHFIVRVKPTNQGFLQYAEKEKTVASVNLLEGKTDVNTFLIDQFKRFFTAYTNTLNKKYKRHGSMFQKKFKRVELITLTHILNKICYVHHNPIHHCAASFYDSWEFSSYKAFLTDKLTKIARQEVLTLFSDSQSVDFFVEYHQYYHENWVKSKFWEDFDEKDD